MHLKPALHSSLKLTPCSAVLGSLPRDQGEAASSPAQPAATKEPCLFPWGCAWLICPDDMLWRVHREGPQQTQGNSALLPSPPLFLWSLRCSAKAKHPWPGVCSSQLERRNSTPSSLNRDVKTHFFLNPNGYPSQKWVLQIHSFIFTVFERQEQKYRFLIYLFTYPVSNGPGGNRNPKPDISGRAPGT